MILAERVVLVSILATVGFGHTVGGTRIHTPYSKLTRDLLDGHDKYVFPANSTEDLLEVAFSISLDQIDELDEVHQKISLTAHIEQNWYNPHLSWNPADYDGITDIRLPADKVWLPDTVLYHNVGEKSGLLTSDVNVVVSHDGYVTWVVPSMLRASCQVDVTYVPFDTQRCILHFASWSYSKDLLTFVNDTVLLDSYKDNGEWMLLNADTVPFFASWTHRKQEMQGVSLVLVLKRHSHFCVLFKVVPFILVAAVSLLVFLLPVDSGEKISLVITNLLTLVLFYVEISDYFPGKDFPYLGVFFFVFVCVVLSSCVLTVLVINTYHSQRPVPGYVHQLFFGCWGLQRYVWYVPRKCAPGIHHRGSSRRKQTSHSRVQVEGVDNKRDFSGNYSRSISEPLNPIDQDKVYQTVLGIQNDLYQAVHRIERMESHLGADRAERQDYEGFEPLSEWKIIAIIMDQIFFLISTAITCSACISFVVTLVCKQDMDELHDVTMDM